MKVKIIQGKVSQVEADASNFMNNCKNFQLHSSTVNVDKEVCTMTLFYTGEEMETKPEKK